MDETNLSPPFRRSQYQFRLMTLLVLVTILCLHFGVAAYDARIAIQMGICSLGIAIIYVARRHFQLSVAAAGFCAICGLGGALGVLMAVTSTAEYFMPPKPGDPPRFVQSSDAIVFFTVIGTITGTLTGSVIAVAYWVMGGIWLLLRSLVIERRDNYYVEDK